MTPTDIDAAYLKMREARELQGVPGEVLELMRETAKRRLSLPRKIKVFIQAPAHNSILAFELPAEDLLVNHRNELLYRELERFRVDRNEIGAWHFQDGGAKVIVNLRSMPDLEEKMPAGEKRRPDPETRRGIALEMVRNNPGLTTTEHHDKIKAEFPHFNYGFSMVSTALHQLRTGHRVKSEGARSGKGGRWMINGDHLQA